VETVNKIIRLLRGPRPLKNALVAINKSPLRHGVKAIVNVSKLKSKILRVRFARKFTLDSAHESCLKELRQNGFCKLDGLVKIELAMNLRNAAQEKIHRAEEIKKIGITSKKEFWVGLLDDDLKLGPLDSKSPYVQFALQENILKLVSVYMGEVPYLSYVFLSLSQYTGKDWEVSQLWHQDRDDVKVVKLFVYLTNVNESGGPFSYFSKDVSKRIPSRFFMKHLSDSDVAKHVDLEKQNSVLGNDLSTFMVDTNSCYHMGSRLTATSPKRLMYTATYVSVPSIYPNPSNKIQVDESLSDLQKTVLSPK
jgi:hypothetical protein